MESWLGPRPRLSRCRLYLGGGLRWERGGRLNRFLDGKIAAHARIEARQQSGQGRLRQIMLLPQTHARFLDAVDRGEEHLK